MITGASSGIGKACCQHLDELGYRVFAGVRRESDCIALQAQASNRVQPLILDVCDPDGVRTAVDRIAEQVGQAGLAGLVNNAGISIAGPLEFLPVEDFRRQLEVNVIGQLTVTQACLPLLRLGHGRVVMMSSTSGLFAPPFLGPYAASKFALEALSDALRVELRPWGISIVLIEPGSIATPIWEKGIADAQERVASMPEAARGSYGHEIDRVIAYAQRSSTRGLPAKEVARVVAEALNSRRPRARYLVVRPGSRLIRQFMRLAPTRLRDWLVARRMGRQRTRI